MISERRQSHKMLLAICTAALIAALSWLVSTAWATKADKATLVEHIYTERVKHVSDSAWHAEQSGLVLEILCRQNPTNRKCR